MEKIKLAFLLTFLAGISTMLGTILIFFKIKKERKIITASLAFASGVMICVSLIDLIPESLSLLSNYFYKFPMIVLSLIFLVIGVLLSMGIDHTFNKTKINKNNPLYKIGLISCIAIILHNIPEGIATFMATNTNAKLGITLAIAIALHNIPEGISISIPIYYATKKKYKALIYTFISGISELIGAFITYLFLSSFINNMIMGFLLSMIAGIMLQISIYELLPTSFSYKQKKTTISYLIIGILFMLISHFIF